MLQRKGATFSFLLVAACLTVCDGVSSSETSDPPDVAGARPNILFVISDDVGINQMFSFGYGGAIPPPMPVIDAVAQSGRVVERMVNAVDLFPLFGDIAGLDVPAIVPRTIDSASQLPYLSRSGQASVRNVNFTQADRVIQGGRRSSIYDFAANQRYDGKTDDRDLFVVQQHMNVTCPKCHALD